MENGSDKRMNCVMSIVFRDNDPFNNDNKERKKKLQYLADFSFWVSISSPKFVN